jgi:tRNA A-37 threonylcarbamoyl transferase component Bud32/tetratricopeptide (TPR) repeat protein
MVADRYRVIERLGSGGMAVVYLAEDQVLGRRVAVKRLRSGDREADVARFRREARLGATLSHPNVVTVFDVLAGEDGTLIVMELVEGKTLADLLDRGRLEPAAAIGILRQVAAALDHAHSHGVVHRDVKPANVLVGEDGVVKLADLGIATAAEATRITAANDIIGTLAYLPPERLEASSPGGPEADVFSLAALAYEALGGERLNRGSTPAEVLHRATTGHPPDLREAWPEAPASLARALQWGMDPDPAKRPGSAGELVDALALAREEPRDEVLTTEISPPTPPPAAASGVADAPRSPAEALAELARSERPRPRAARWAALGVAALARVALVIVLAPGGEEGSGGGGGDGEQAAREGGQQGSGGGGAGQGGAAVEPEAGSGEESEAGGEDAASGAELNEQGYALIQEGNHADAVPVLQRAVDSFPEGSDDLNYAYALFNLGNALRESGRPAEAIGVLERRLEIPNQRGAVKRELELARAEAGVGED